MKTLTPKAILAVPCPTCGAKPGQECELNTGKPRSQSHFDRRITAKDHRSTEVQELGI